MEPLCFPLYFLTFLFRFWSFGNLLIVSVPVYPLTMQMLDLSAGCVVARGGQPDDVVPFKSYSDHDVSNPLPVFTSFFSSEKHNDYRS